MVGILLSCWGGLFSGAMLVLGRVGGGFKRFFIFTPIPGEMIQFDEHNFQLGWFNHQLVTVLDVQEIFF